MENLPSDLSQWPWVPLAAALVVGLFLGFLFGGRRRKVARIERVADPVAPLRAELDTAHRTRADLQRQLDEARAGRAQAEAELAAVRADMRGSRPSTPLGGAPAVERVATVRAGDAGAPASPLRADTSPAGGGGAAGVDAPAGAAMTDLPVTRLKGVGPKLGGMLEAQGVGTVGRLAALSEQEAADLDTRLGDFSGRLGRDRVVEQARMLAEGRQAEYAAKFGAV